MAAALPHDLAARQLAAFLVKAAGVEMAGVRSIECRCAYGEVPTFKIELQGQDEPICKALEEAEKIGKYSGKDFT